ncbi:MAG: hypothetical protein K0B09_12915 [Bacteroidales bacterium]|nr:hypothetical protein [Bacteroidales bacterium]
MKKFYFVTMILALAVVFNACQKDEMLPYENSLEIFAFQEVAPPYSDDAWENYCIDPELDNYVVLESSVVGSIGGNSKSISYSAYNTESLFIIKLSYLRTPATAGVKSTVSVGFEETTQNKTFSSTQGEILTFEFNLPVNWKGGDEVLISFIETIFDGQNALTEEFSYALIGICEDGCELDFKGEGFVGEFEVEEEIFNRKAIYTFLPEEDGVYEIQGGLTNFTGADALVFASNGDVNQRTPGGSSNRIITVEGEFEACEEISIVIYWNSDNQGDEITGEWTVKLNNDEIASVEPLN